MNIVFDFGGVLFRWQPHEFMARLLPERSKTPEAVQALVTEFFQGFGGDWAAFDRGTMAPDVLAVAIAQRMALSVHEVRRVIDAVAHELLPVPGTVALLRRLASAGHPLFFLSNMPQPYACHLESRHGFLRLFRDGLFSSRIQLIKPEPQIFAHARVQFGVEPDCTLLIDDLASNTAAACQAGWKALHFQSPDQCERELVQLGLLPALA